MAVKSKPAQSRVAEILSIQISVEKQHDGSFIWTHTPPPLEAVTAEAGKEPRVRWRPIWCAGYELDEAEVRHYHHLECIPCHCPPGPQMWPTMSGADEMSLVGTRGSAKSEGTFSFLTSGNPAIDLSTMQPGFDQLNRHPADTTYLSQPDYSFLVLRKNSKDLLSYFKRASRYFKLFGGEMTQEPMGVKFPTGAYGIFDHLADSDAYEKYVGQEFTRIVLEEANQIPEESRYLKILGSCRTSNRRMRARIVLTYNPGGPGARWLKSRFFTPGGQRLPFGQLYVDPFSGKSRITVFSSVEDNPYTMATGYDKTLDLYKSSDPTLYKQWRLGDFDAQSGQFFEMFRDKVLRDPTGKAIEAENAVHCVKPRALPGEWPTAISCDWGYSHPSAVYWGKWSPKKQLHVYRELVISRMGCRELGAEIARRSLDDLGKSNNPHFTLHLSHDAFHRENEGHTEAELIQEGIESILGAGTAFVFDRTEEERLLDRDVSWEAVKTRADKRRKSTYITIRNAGMARRANLNLIRDYMRWEPINSATMVFSPEAYINLLEREGEHAAQEYRRKCDSVPEAENLPVIQIHYDGDALDPRDRGCEKLIVSIQSMVEKEKNSEEMEKQEGDDPVDSLGYLVGNFHYRDIRLSDEETIRRKLDEIKDKTPGIEMNSLIRHAERMEYEARLHKPVGRTFGRSVRRMPSRTRMFAGAR